MKVPNGLPGEIMTVPTSQPTTEIQPAARRVVGVIIVVLIGLCLLFVVGYVQRLAEKEAVLAEISALEQQITEAEVRNAVLAKELAQANDDAHIAAIARDALNLVQEGDQLITLIDPPAGGATDQTAPLAVREPVNTQPNWQRWLDLVFASE
jgi:cell division protein FtsB